MHPGQQSSGPRTFRHRSSPLRTISALFPTISLDSSRDLTTREKVVLYTHPAHRPRKNPPTRLHVPPQRTRPRGIPLEGRRVAEHDLIDEIVSTARRIAEARDWNGEPVSDGIWRVIMTIASSPYCLAIADLGRALHVRKQVAHELAHEAPRQRFIDLESNPHDKRILQAVLAPRGRAELAAARTAEEIWRATLLNGLGDRELKATAHVIRVIRQRLERQARELA